MATAPALLPLPDPPRLSPAMSKVVLHWGEMGARWGVNRSVAQIHALLWLVGRPLPAEDIAETLAIARSNVSTSLDELQGYKLVTLVHVIGDRRNLYLAKTDPWEIVRTIIDERKKREIDPSLETLRAASAAAEADNTTPADVKKRMAEMAGFMERMTGWYDQMKNVPRPMLERMIKLGTRIVRLLGASK
jgi:DNA-binding transcriptional regulator GbsR (MarR family)